MKKQRLVPCLLLLSLLVTWFPRTARGSADVVSAANAASSRQGTAELPHLQSIAHPALSIDLTPSSLIGKSSPQKKNPRAIPPNQVGDVTHYYIDAGNGSDMTGDGSANHQWQTITHALSQVIGPNVEIHVAPGTYDEALGENFPIVMQPGVSLIATGYSSTTISGNGTDNVIHFPNTDVYSETTVVSGFKITNGFAGIRVDGRSVDDPSPTIRANWITGNTHGVHIDTRYGSRAYPFIASNRIETNHQHGLYLVAYRGVAIAQPTIQGNTIVNNGGSGVYCYARGAGYPYNDNYGLCNPTLLNNFIADNTGDGVTCHTAYCGGCSPQIIANTIADNGGWGWGRRHDDTYLQSTRPSFVNNFIYGNADGGAIFVNRVSAYGDRDAPTFINDTIAYNSSYGILDGHATIVNSIVWGHTSDLNAAVSAVSYSDVSQGAYVGQNNNISLNPQFVDPDYGDYHVLPTSPVLDAGDSTHPDLPATDIDGDVRVMEAAVDIGADEFNPEPVAGLGAVNDSPTPLGWPTVLTATIATGSSVTYTWALGDGTTNNRAVVTHFYPAIGQYTAVVTASNGISTLTDTTVVNIEPPFIVTATSPPDNDRFLTSSGIISVTFVEPVSSSTVSPGSFAVWGRQTGLYLQSYTIADRTVSFDAQPDYKPGEEIVVSLSHGLKAAADGAPLTPFAWQFRSAVTDHGAGYFLDSNQQLGSSRSFSIALGDLDGDGDLDAFVVNDRQANQVWVNDGTGNFSNSEQELGDSTAIESDVALGDLDGDGDLDAFVANYGANEVLLNNGEGRFDHHQGLGDSRSVAVALGDLDGDGDLDVFVANWDNQPNRVWLNDGEGDLSDSGQLLGNSQSFGAALGDLDGDGDLDAFIANGYGQSNEVWLNDGWGYFNDSGQRLASVSYSSRDVALGDLDGDGDLDAFIAETDANEVWLNDGASNFSVSDQRLGTSSSKNVILGDVDGDGDLDAFVANWYNQSNKVWLNDGASNFSDSGQALGHSTSHVELGDLDGDGDLDAFETDYNWDYGQPAKVWWNRSALASFVAWPTAGTWPQTVIFTNTLLAGNEFIWDYGDGLTSSIATMTHTHTYTASGVYSVTLTAIGPYDQHMYTRTHYISVYDPPTAGFTGAPRSGAVPLLVDFSNSSLNSTWYDWDFGDGGSSSDVNPSHIYEIGGIYTVTLRASNPGGTDTLVRLAYITAQGPPTANFYAERTVGIVPFTVTLHNTTQFADTFFWDYGDGQSSTITDTVHAHVYTTPGIYTVTLTAYNEYGSDVNTRPNYIEVYNAPVAYFDAAPLNGTIPLAVSFTNRSQNATDYWWQFGDGGTSVDRDPIHTYSIPGQYTVTLRASNPAAASTITRTNYITAYETPIVGLAAINDGPTEPGETTTLTATITAGSNVVYTWNFGDGNIGTGALVTHTYSPGNTYTAVVTAGNPAGELIATTTVVVKDFLTVSTTSPPDNDRVVDRNSVLSAIFNRVVDSGTVTTHTFTVGGKQTGAYTRSYNIAGNTVSFDAQPDYKPGEEIVVNLSHDIKAPDGVALSPYQWQFRAGVQGGSGIFADSGRGLDFSSKMDLALGDLDGDGDVDTFIANGNYPDGEPDQVWLNDGAGNFYSSGQVLGNLPALRVTLGDVDSDGDLDAVVANNTQPIAVWLNSGTGTFSPGQTIENESCRDTALGDFDGDGDLDMFVANWGSWPYIRNQIWLNDGSGNFSDSGQRLGNSDSWTVKLGDLDNDGDIDAFVGNYYWGANEVWLNNGVGDFNLSQSLGSFSTTGLALGDLDRDGDLDAFVVNPQNEQTNEVWLNDGTGHFALAQSLGGSWSFDVALGDVDGDGDLDALVVDSGLGEEQKDELWLNNGAGFFSDSGQRLGDSPSYAVDMGDIDGDGDLDALILVQGEEVRVWLNQDAPSLTISKNGPITATVGAPITYTLHVVNSGNAAATHLNITDTVPSGANFMQALDGGYPVGDVVLWTLGDLAAGGDASVRFVVTATKTIANSDYGATADGGYVATGSATVVTTVSEDGFVPSLIIPPSGGIITPTQGVTISASSGVFSDTVIVIYAARPITHTGTLSHVGLFYDVSAVYQSTGQLAQPQPGQHYTITVTYQQENVPVVLDEADLALYYREDTAWIKEPSSIVDAEANAITATPGHFSLWAALAPGMGNKSRVYLPLIFRR